MALSENGGHPGGQFGADFDSSEDIRRQVVDELDRGLKSLIRLRATLGNQDAQVALTDEVRSLNQILNSVDAMQLDDAGSGR